MYFSNFLQYHFKSLLQPSVFQDFPARSWANCIQTCQRCTLGCFLSLPSPPSHFSSYFPPQTSKTCYEKLSSAVLEHRSRKKSCGDWGLRGRSRPGPSRPVRSLPPPGPPGGAAAPAPAPGSPAGPFGASPEGRRRRAEGDGGGKPRTPGLWNRTKAAAARRCSLASGLPARFRI